MKEKCVSRVAFILCSLILAILLTQGGVSIGIAQAAGPTVITFEDLAAGSPGSPATVWVSSQYAGQGITFNTPVAIDYSKGSHAVPGFAHSGVKAIEQCYSQEHCRRPIEMKFATPQAQVKLWAGHYRELGGPDARVQVMLRAFRADGAEVGHDVAVFDPSGWNSIPIAAPLKVALPDAVIVRATVNLVREDEGFFTGIETNHLSVDDVEFDTTPPSGCLASGPPQVTLSRPADDPDPNNPDSIVYSAGGNVLEVGGTVNALSAPIETATVTVTDSSGQTGSWSLMGGPTPLRPQGGSFASSIPEILSPGMNEVAVRVRNCRGETTVTREVQLILPNIVAADLEVTQAIQSLSNDVPLIADKATYARLYVRAVDAGDQRLPAGTASLRLTRDGESIELEPLNVLNSQGGIFADKSGGTRANRDDAFLFRIPPEWRSGTVTFEAEVRPHRSVDLNPSDNHIFRTLTFGIGPRICVNFVSLHLHPKSYSEDPSRFGPILRRMQKVYPVSDVDGVKPLFPGTVFPDGHDGGNEWKDLSDWLVQDHIFTELAKYTLFSSEPTDCIPMFKYGNGFLTYGMADPDSWWDGGLSNGYRLAYGSMIDENSPGEIRTGGVTMAHEMGHCFGFKHVLCPKDGPDVPEDPDLSYPYDSCMIGDGTREGYYGFDVDTQQPIAPDAAGDMMSYSHKMQPVGRPLWTSRPTFCKLLEAIPARPGTAKLLCRTASLATAAGIADGEAVSPTDAPAKTVSYQTQEGFLAAGGIINTPDATATFDYFYRLEHPSPNAIASSGRQREGDVYELALLNSAGSLLRSHLFSPDLVADGSPGSSSASFLEVFPFDARTAEIVLRRDGETLASRKVSRHSPEVRLLEPRHGEEVGKTITVRWRGSDRDGGELRYAIQYSADNGHSWLPLAVSVGGDRLRVDTTLLPGSDEARIRVVVTDGVNTSMDTSDHFKVKRKPPLVSIVSPEEGARFLKGAPVLFRGQAFTLDGDSLRDRSFSWRSNRDGKLGKGRELLAESLSHGRHRIRLKVTDRHGKSETAQMHIVIVKPDSSHEEADEDEPAEEVDDDRD